MTSWKKSILVIAAFALLATPAVRADWLHFADTLIQATEEVQKHPETALHDIIVRKAIEDPTVCVGYTNNLAKKNKGRVVTDVLIMAADGTETTKRLIGNVKKNAALSCKALGFALNPGDVAFFFIDMRKFPRLRNSGTRLDYAEITAMISAIGAPMLGQAAPLGFVPAKAAAPYGLLPQPASGRYRSARSLFQVDDDKLTQKHPELVERSIPIRKEFRKPSICVSYSNMALDAGAGRVVATVKIRRTDESVETLKISGSVKKNAFLGCKEPAAKIEPDSFVDFSIELKDMDRLANRGDLIAFADVTTVVTNTGEPVFRAPPPPPPPPPAPEPAPTQPTTPAPTNPAPTGGGGISAADEAAAVRLFNGKGVQLQRPKGNSPGKFMAVGPKTTLLPGSTFKVDPKTTGVGGTIAAAVADYEKKHKTNFPSGGSLDSTTKSLLAWYAGMDASNGPTSIRKDTSGRYHGEYYRTFTGQQHKTLGSLQSVLDWLKKQGL